MTPEQLADVQLEEYNHYQENLIWEGTVRGKDFRLWLNQSECDNQFYIEVKNKEGQWTHWDVADASAVAEHLISPYLQQEEEMLVHED